MSWLYNHRYELGELRFLAEIAHWYARRVTPEDHDDVEQEIILSLIETAEKEGSKPRSYFEAVARNRLYAYLNKKYREKAKLGYIFENNKGEKIIQTWEVLRDGDGDLDVLLDAKLTLANLPKRLVEIGYKRLNGEKLTDQESDYCTKQLAKLRPKLKFRRYGNRLSGPEKQRILELNSRGVSMSKIARTMGRSNQTIMRFLGSKRLSREDWLNQMKIAAREKQDRIRFEYFVNGKTVRQIAREYHCADMTVYDAIRSPEAASS